MDDRRLFLEWRDQSESTLHIDGLPYYGFDVAHKKAPLPPGTREVWIESVVCQTGIWHPQATGLSPDGSVLDGASLLHRNETAWRVHCDLQVLADLMREELKAAFPGRDHEFGAIGTKPTLGVLPPLLRRLLRWLERVLNILEINGLKAAQTELEKAFIDLPGSHQPPAAILTCQAHIDLEIGRFHSAMPREEQPAAPAEWLFQSPVFFDGQVGDCGFLGLEGGESLHPVWAVPVDETSWTLRLRETLRCTGRTRLILAPGWKATRVNLSGNPIRRTPPPNRFASPPTKS
jgi:hypothetical protein